MIEEFKKTIRDNIEDEGIGLTILALFLMVCFAGFVIALLGALWWPLLVILPTIFAACAVIVEWARDNG